jgi:hypothetical protein
LPSRSRRTIAHRRSLLRPPSFAAGHRDPDRSLYWRSRRNLLLDLDRGRSTGARVLRRCSWHRRIGRLPAVRPVLPVYNRQTGAERPKAYRAGWRRSRNPPPRCHQAADYAGACHRAARCADPVGSNPPYVLRAWFSATGRYYMNLALSRGNSAGRSSSRQSSPDGRSGWGWRRLGRNPATALTAAVTAY